MIDFYVVTSGNFNSLDGASKFCKTLCSDQAFWKSNGINVIPLSNSFFYDVKEYTASAKHMLKQAIKKLLESTNIGKNISFFKYSLNGLGKRVVDQIPGKMDESTWILINDLNIAGNYYEKFGDTYNTIFMMHNSGDMLSMLKPLMQSKKIEKYLRQLETIIFDKATKLVFVSKYAYDMFVRSHPQYKEKCEYVFNGIEDFQFDLSNRDYSKLRLVTIGTVGKRKNQIAIMKAIKEINDTNIELTVVGDGPMYQECMDYVMANHLTNQITMVGAQTDVKPFLCDANAFIMTSLDEGLPIAATEALNASLPIAITEVGGCKDLVKNNGILIKPDNDKEIVKAINFLRENICGLKAMGENSRKLYIENFTLKKMLESYLRIVSR